MLFLVEVRLKHGVKNQVVDTFEIRGPNRNPAVQFVKAWLGVREDIAFVLISSEHESHLADSCRAWSTLGETEIHPVIDIEDY